MPGALPVALHAWMPDAMHGRTDGLTQNLHTYSGFVTSRNAPEKSGIDEGLGLMNERAGAIDDQQDGAA